jgi:hypothetical protein
MELWSENLKLRDQLEDVGIDKRWAFEIMFKK